MYLYLAKGYKNVDKVTSILLVTLLLIAVSIETRLSHMDQ
jgi:hypothetical protein